MNNPVIQPSPANATKPPDQESDHDDQSVDSSEDSGSSTNSARSSSGDSASDSKSMGADAPVAPGIVSAAVTVESEAASSKGSEGSSSGQSESESGAEQSSDEDAASPELNNTFVSATEHRVVTETVVLQSPVFATPSASLMPSSKAASPTASRGAVKVAGATGGMMSPTVVTPCKSLVLESGHTPKTSKSSTPPPVGAKLNQPVQQIKGVPVKLIPGAVIEPAALVGQQHEPGATISDVTLAKSGKRGSSSKASAELPIPQPPPKIRREDKLVEGTAKDPKKRTKNKKKSSSKTDKCVEKDTVTVGLAEAAVVKMERKKAKKSEKYKAPVEEAAAVVSSATSGDDSQSSGSDRPGPSSGRIAKIPQGRRFQQLAMSRSKHWGFIKDSSVQAAEVSKALKKVRTAKFNIQPTHSYKNYNRIFGTDLPHICQHMDNIIERYNAVLRATSELELTLTHNQDVERSTLVKPDAQSPFFPIWQFDNDVAYAESSPSYRVTRPAKAAAASKESGTVEFKEISSLAAIPARGGLVVSHEEAATSSGQAQQLSSVSQSVDGRKPTKKRKKHKSSAKITNINQLPADVLGQVLSYIHWKERFKLELVKKKWKNILRHKSMRKVDSDLNTLVKDYRNLPDAVVSLVIGQSRIIEGIVIGHVHTDFEQYFNAALARITGLGVLHSNYLKRLNVKIDSTSTLNSLVELIHLSVNLEVLELECSNGPTIVVDLSGLVKLKKLNGWSRVQFINCRSPNLVELHYFIMDVDEFVQMLLVAADSIEKLLVTCALDNGLVNVNGPSIKMPKLTRLLLSIVPSTNINFTIDLAESKDLHTIVSLECDNHHGIINFDFAVHRCIKGIDCKYNLGSQVVRSAKLYPDRLCLLDSLRIRLSSCDDFKDWIGCFSNCSYNYRFRVFTVLGLEGKSPAINYVNIFNLIKCSPYLREFKLMCSINKQCLIDLIVQLFKDKINCDHLKFYISSVSGCSQFKFLIDLYGALCGLNLRPVQSSDKVNISIYCNISADTIELTNNIRDEFGVNFV